MPHCYGFSLLRALLIGGVASLLASAAYAQAPTVLRAGDLVFTGVNTADPDEFTFAPLVDLAAGTQIQFTDNGWLAAGGFRATEGVATYTAPTTIGKGTLLRFTREAGLSSAGFSATGQFLLAADGDQVLAYQGPASNPTFISALTTKAWALDATSAATSTLPRGLVNGSTALVVPRYNACMSQSGQRRGTGAQLRQWFATATSWTNPVNSSTRYNWMATAPFNQNLQINEGLVPDADELLALQALYTSTNGPSWTQRTNWPSTPTPWPITLSNVDFATWYGITVTNGDVTAVQLNSNHLDGTLPIELGKLTQLLTLQLRDNVLQGGVPAELNQATGLQIFDLGYNRLVGDLPSVVTQWAQMQYLSLDYNQFTGSIPAALGQCRQLKYVFLSYNQLAGAVPVSLGRLARLEALLLDHNQFSGSLPDSLARLSVLNALSLRNNQFSGPIPAGWQQLTQLTALRLEDNRLSGALPPGVAALPNLFSLGLARNRLTGTIPPFLGTAPSAVTGFADFSDNDFTGLTPYTGVSNYSTKNLLVANNRLDFAALEPSFPTAGAPAYASFSYAPQRAQTPADTARYLRGGALQLSRQPTGTYNNPPQWEREVGGAWTDVPGATASTLTVPNATEAAQGLYRLRFTNAWVPNLTLYMRATYADLVPYLPLLENRPVDGGTQSLATAFAPVSRGSATDTVNYLRTYAARAAYTNPARLVQAVVDSVQISTQYLDGLGRPVQTVLWQESPGRRDLVQPMAYDALGRQPRQYLSYVVENASSTAGDYRPDALYEQSLFYQRTTVPGGGAGPLAPTDPVRSVVRTGVPFGETAFEASPLNRVLAQAAAGESWQMATGRVVSRLERPNVATDSVQYFVPGYGSSGGDLTPAGGYAAGELWGTQTTDEQVGPDGKGYRTIEWKDKQAQTVLKQVEAKRVGTGTAARSRWLRTYYVFDDFGHLRAVLPPAAVKAMQANTWAVNAAAEKFLFRYRYDGRGRVTGKQVPGTDGETAVVYNLLDQPVLTQDAAQRGRNEWAFVKYDALGRPVLTGLVTRAGFPTTPALQAEADATAAQFEQRTATAGTYPQYYTTDQAYPRLGQQGFSAGQVLSATYYDDYNFDSDAAGTADATYDAQLDAQLGVAPVPDNRVTGLVTRTQTRVLGVAATAPGAWLTATTFYDERARPIQVQSTNARGGQDLVTSQLDFTGQVRQRIALHHGPSLLPTGLQVAETMSYDHAGRLLTTYQQLSGEPRFTLIASLTYNELGQLMRKTIGTGALTQNLDYAYNVRGWLTGLNDAALSEPSDLFGLALCYERGFTGTYEQFNGNLTGQKWRSKRDGIERAYGYAYDPLSRLLQGDYVARAGTTATAPWTAEAGNYRLHGVSYDDQGSLLTLRRRGLLANATRLAPKQYGPVDMLTYRYDGNRLQAVDDQVSTNQLPRPTGYHGAPTSLAGDFQEQGIRQQTEYTYDANGSLTADRNKGITAIAYNHLNLPRLIRFGTGADSLVFRYSAAGQKVAKLVYQTGKPTLRTDYLGPYQYEQDSLRFFPHAEGRVLRFVTYNAANQPTTRYEREFTFKDHLGNLRLSYRRGKRLSYATGLEPGDAIRESQQFDSLSVSAPIAQRPPAVNNVSPTHTGAYVAWLNAAPHAVPGPPAATVGPTPLGPLKQLAVQKGDTITVTAPGYYPQPVQSSSFAFSLAAFVAGLLQQQPALPSGGLDGGGRTRPLPLLSIGVSAGLPALTQVSGGVPKGYVRLLVFDADSNLVSSQTQTRQLTSAARTNYEDLSVQVIVQQNGYVTAYVGNESAADVYFDDVTVEHHQGLQVQETEYDPTGLELAGLGNTTPGLKPLNKYRWNGKEFQPDLGLNWTQLDWRMVDPQLGGGFHVVDPEVENGQESMSPYAFGYDNAVRYNDPNGRQPQGPGDDVPTVARGFVEFSASVANLVLSSWAYTIGSSTKLEAQVYETSTSLGINYARVPVGGLAQEAKSTALDVVKVAINALPAGRAGGVRALEQAAGRAGEAVVAQEVKSLSASSPKLIGPSGDAGAKVTQQIPKGWDVTGGRKGGVGTRFSDPKNPTGNNVRVMPGNKNSPNVEQQAPYVKQVKNGQQMDVNGEKLPNGDVGPAHIPRDQFKF